MIATYISKIISLIKKEKYELDPNIPIGYLFASLASKAVTLFWGIVRLKKIGLFFIHPSATLKCVSKIKCGKNFSVGKRAYIDALSIQGLICGKNVSIGFQTHIELTGSMKLLGKGMIIGNNVGLGTHGYYGSGAGLLEIGDNTIFGNYVSIHPENHNYNDSTKLIRLQGVNGKGIKIGTNCWIGAKVTILDGTFIGDNSIVAAGAVVRGRFPNNVIIGGVPARIIKRIYQ